MTTPWPNHIGDHPAGSALPPGPPFDLELERVDGSTRLRLKGELDMATAAQLRDAIAVALEAGPRDLAIDLIDLTFIDSTGIGVLAGAARRAASGGCQLVLLSPSKPVLKVLRLTGIDRVIAVEPVPLST